MFELLEDLSSTSKLFQSMMVEGKNDFENFVLLHLKFLNSSLLMSLWLVLSCFSNTLRTLIFARHLFSRVDIFAAYIFAPEVRGINFR